MISKHITAQDISWDMLDALMINALRDDYNISERSFPKLNINGHELPLVAVYPEPNVDDKDSDKHVFSHWGGSAPTINPQKSDYYQVYFKVADDCDVAIEVKRGETSCHISGWDEHAEESKQEFEMGDIERVEGVKLIDQLGEYLQTNGQFLAHFPQFKSLPSRGKDMAIPGMNHDGKTQGQG